MVFEDFANLPAELTDAFTKAFSDFGVNLEIISAGQEVFSPATSIVFDQIMDVDEDSILLSITLKEWEPKIRDISPILTPTNIPALLWSVPLHDFNSAAFHYVIGLGLYAVGQYDNAIESFAHMLNDPAKPQQVVSLFFRANSAIMQNNYEQAAQFLEDLQTVIGDESLGYFRYPVENLAWLYLKQNREDDAFNLFTDALNSSEGSEKTLLLNKRSQLYALAFRYDEAIADMDTAIALDPNNPLLFVERGKHIMLLYEWDRALADFNHALELNPAYADAYYFRGILYASVPEGVEARQLALADFRRYLELAPNGQHAASATESITSLQAQLDALAS